MKKKDEGNVTFFVGDFNNRPDAKPIEMILGVGFKDTYREFHPDEEKHPGYTGPVIMSKDNAEQNFSKRIDYVMVRVPPGMEDRVKILDSVVCFREPRADGLYPSDHLGVMTTFEISY